MLSFVFFFFKQKTAYEMRISDWSSDVCSSDLKRRARITATREIYAKCILFDYSYKFFYEDGYGKESLIRSEEHTSELQSLMRISYAVFCLKKKNKHKKTIIEQPQSFNTCTPTNMYSSNAHALS